MKSSAYVTATAALSALAAASPLTRRDDSSANDWDPILNGDAGAQCADLAVIFARGTFDPEYVFSSPDRFRTLKWNKKFGSS